MSIKLKLKNLLINLAISLISIFLTLVLIEFAFRKFVFNYYRTPKGNEILLFYGIKESSIPGVPYEFIPNYGDENSNWHFNSFGFRGKEIKVPKPPNIYRIVLLGDSQVFGGEDIKGTISAFLEDFLNSDSELVRDGTRFEVVNGGFFSLNIKELSIILRHKVKKIEPDLIIYNFFVNDFDESTYTIVRNRDGLPVLLSYMSIYGENDLLGGKINILLNRYSLFYRYIGHMIEDMKFKRRTKDWSLMDKYDKTHLRFPMVVYLDDMIRDSRSIKAGFMTSVLTCLQHMSSYRLDDYNADVLGEYIRYAKSRGVIVISLLDTLCGKPVEELDRGDGAHFKDWAHKVFAQRIYNELKAYFKNPEGYLLENSQRKIHLTRVEEY